MGASDRFESGLLDDGTPGDLVDLAEIERYADAVRAFAAGEIPDDRFTAMRLQQGCYGQRQPGVNMLRVKAPGGKLDADKLDAIADVVASFVDGERAFEPPHAHVTTRESIQIHSIPLEKTPDAMRRLANAKLTTREACGNTVRNMTACPMAGACPRERTDINRHLDHAARYFLRNPLNQQMPRKFKISFSACESDCAQGLLHDLGVVATVKDGRPGFRVLAGGGLGHKPREAIVVREFVSEGELIPAMEAVIELHNTHSDRSKRAKSRLKFLVERFGEAGFRARFDEAFERARAAHASREHPDAEWFQPQNGPVPGPGAPRAPFAQRQHGFTAIPVALPLGQISPDALRGLAALLGEHDLDDVRTVQDQNLVIRNVPAAEVPAVVAGLKAVGLGLPKVGDNVVACPGTSTCRLGITASPTMGARLAGIAGDLRIRVSGCHNGCAQPETGDIGIYGEGRRMHDRLVPHYQLYLGGDGMAGGRLARKGPSIPVARIEAAIARIVETFGASRSGDERFFDWVHRQSDEYFATLLADFVQVAADEMPAVLRDIDGETDFKVAQLGGGECAGASQVFIGAAFFASAHERRYRDAFAAQSRADDALACARAQLRLIAQGLHDLASPTPAFRVRKVIDDLGELSTAVKDRIPGALAEPLARFATALFDDAPLASLIAIFAAIDAWVHDAAQFCVQRDPQLDIAGALPRGSAAAPLRFTRRPLETALAAD
ncbi:MAG TPA: nitrite/sulfite reductase [Casimicrobiaceae bacterium]|nr:nitrite/sulfite reductase [Casimicrobiaceae bacterium]